MLCNPSPSVLLSRRKCVCSSLRMFPSVVFVKQFLSFFLKHYQNWNPSMIVPKQHISEPHTTTPLSHIDTEKYLFFLTFFFLVSVACA